MEFSQGDLGVDLILTKFPIYPLNWIFIDNRLKCFLYQSAFCVLAAPSSLTATIIPPFLCGQPGGSVAQVIMNWLARPDVQLEQEFGIGHGAGDCLPTLHNGHHGIYNVQQRMLAYRTPIHHSSEGWHTE